jgi:hypothetical protein
MGTRLKPLLRKNYGLSNYIKHITCNIPLTLYPRYSSETPTFYQNDLAVKNTADVTGGKPIAILLQSISGVSAINPLVAFYDIHGGKREALFFYFVPDTTRDDVTCFVTFSVHII